MNESMNPLDVLIVDDDPIALRFVSKVVTSLGHTVTTAENGLQARDLLSERSFDVVICDFIVPGFDGRELLQWLRWKGVQSAFAIVSGYYNESFQDDFTALGANAIFSKPVDAQTLRSFLHQCRPLQRPKVAPSNPVPVVTVPSAAMPTVEPQSVLMVSAHSARIESPAKNDQGLLRLLQNIPGAVASARVSPSGQTLAFESTAASPNGAEQMLIDCARSMVHKEALIDELHRGQERIEQIFFRVAHFMVFSKMNTSDGSAVCMIADERETNMGLARLMFDSFQA